MLRHLGSLVLAMSIAAGGVTYGQTELIVNGGFETGDLTGWSVINSGLGNWSINNGTMDPFGPANPASPVSGNFDAVTVNFGPGTHTLCQSLTVPDNVGLALLSYEDRIQNFAAGFADPDHEFRVVVFDVNLAPLVEIYSTDPGDPTQQLGPNLRLFDVTAALQELVGQDICLGFVQQDSMGFFNVTIDNVSLLVGEAPEPEPEPTIVEVPLDVKPGSDRNPINLKTGRSNNGKSRSAGGVLPVAILSADEFNATLVDESTLQLGDPNLSGAALPLRAAEEDVDGDGSSDLMLHFSLAELVENGAIDGETEELLLTGAMVDGAEIFGVDHVDVRN